MICKIIDWKTLQKHEGKSKEKKYSNPDELIRGKISENSYEKIDVTLLYPIIKKGNEEVIVLKNSNYMRNVKENYKFLFLPFLWWIVPSIIISAILIWMESMLATAVIVVGIYRFFKYLLVFSHVTKEIQIKKFEVTSFFNFSDRKRFKFDKLEIVSTPNAEIVYFLFANSIVDSSFILWCEGEDRDKFKNLIDIYQEKIFPVSVVS